jgi:Photoprotection regulator fluorescence recovery protein
MAEAKRMMASVANPSELWRVEADLTENRHTVDRTYQLRYSDLLRVFTVLMRDEWLNEADLVGLQPEKIANITRSAEGLRRMFREWTEHSSPFQPSDWLDSDSIIHGFRESLQPPKYLSIVKGHPYA